MRNLLILCFFMSVAALQAQTYLMDNNPVTTCSGSFYDSGNIAGDYINAESYTKTFTPSTAGNMLQFTFTSFNTENCCDYLRIYDGPTTASPLIGQYQGASSPGIITASNPSGQMTFQWYSDHSIVYSGWAASISCVSPPSTYLISSMGNINT